MSTTPALLTMEEFHALPDDPKVKRELHEGMVIEMGCGNGRHETLKARFTMALAVYLAVHNLGIVYSESAYALSPEIDYQPDVSVQLGDWTGRETSTGFRGAPDIAIEVVSSEEAAYLQRKVANFRKHGSKAVWVAYPQSRVVAVWDAQGYRELTDGDYLENPTLLPGFRLAISDLFA